MRKLWWQLSILGLGVIGVTACSRDDQNQNNSSLTDVTSTSSGRTFLYWQEQTDLFRAPCTQDKPINRTNCATKPVKVAAAEVSKKANDIAKTALNATVTAIAAEVKLLKDSDPSILALTQQVESLTIQKTSVRNAITTDTKQIEADTALKTQLDEQLVYDNQQLSAIAKQLRATPNDRDLIILRAQVQAQFNEHTAKSTAVISRLERVQQHLAKQNETYSVVEAALMARQSELTKFLAEVEVFSPKLDLLRMAHAEALATLNAIPEVLKYIGKGNIIFRGGIWPKDYQNALAKIEQAFGPISLLNAGTYAVESGYSGFCKQKVEPISDTQIDITFLPSCTEKVVHHICVNEVCTAKDVNTSFTIMNPTHYKFKSGGYEAVFVATQPN